MSEPFRKLLALLLCGFIHYFGLLLFFVFSGAQAILANAAYQSPKFLNAFFGPENPPRMAEDSALIYKGFFLVGLCFAGTFILLNQRLSGNWLRKGFFFGCIAWLMMIPWFEFYLPYNVMREPLSLVVLESALWFCVCQLTSCSTSFILNFAPAKTPI